MKIISYFSFILFSIFYLTTASTIALPSASTLRWVGSFLLVGCVLIEMSISFKKNTLSIPNCFIYLFVALIPTLLGIAGEATFYSYGRIVSFFLIVWGLLLFFNMKSISTKDLVCFFELYTLFAGIMMVLSVTSGHMLNDRFSGIYANPNQLSCIAVFTFIASAGLFFALKGKARRLLYGVFALLAAYCVLQTGSRMGAASLLLIIFIIPFILGKDNTVQTRIKQISLILFVGAIVLFILDRFEIVGLQRLLGTFDSNVESSLGASRGDTWSDVYNIFSKKPLLGWGYGQVNYKVFEAKDTTYNWGIHSSYFSIICEMGIVGSLLFLGFFLSYFSCVRKLYKKANLPDTSTQLFKFLVLICFAMFLNAYSESYLFSMGNPMSVGFWLPFIMLYALPKKYIEAGSDSTTDKPVSTLSKPYFRKR